MLNGDTSGDASSTSRAWLYVAILTVGYLVGRGLANSGVRDPYWSGVENDHR